MKKKLIFFVQLFLLSATSVAVAQVPPDTLRKYRQVINETANENGHEAYIEMRDKYVVDRRDVKRIQRLLFKREKRKAICRYMYPNSIHDRVKAKRHIDEIYRDSLDAILIPFNKGISGENISAALLTARALKMDESKYKTVLDKALSIARQKRINPDTDTWDEELDLIKATFDKEQMKNFFSIKDAKEATDKMNEAWKAVCEAGQAEELDSATECAKAYMYIREELRLRCIYRNKKDILDRNLKNLHRQMPPLLRRQEALLKGNDATEEKRNEDNNGIIW